ncbi:MAG TPA: hypothetical protein VIM11_03305 [Tepidisphaeraceae bacterium]|jgi:hypothetical protein
MFVGFAGYIVLSILWFVGASGFANVWTQAIIIWAYGTVGILGFALWLRLARGYKGYGYGVITALMSALIIGIALTILIIAKCSGH